MQGLRPALIGAASSLALLAGGNAATAQSLAYNAPNFISVAGAQSVDLNGVTYTNKGLVGTARLPANLHDFNGETLGSFSGLSIDLKSWRRNADGSYAATMFTLPDRGPNNIGGFTTTNYAARLNQFTLAFSPYTGATAISSSTQQMTLTQAGGFLLRDQTGQLFTGRDPQAGTLTRDGIVYPTPPAGDAGAGKIAMDAEAVAFLRDGSFYIGDEYGAMIYYFDASGRQVGAIQAQGDLLPRVNGAVNFNGTNDMPIVPGSTGRRSNQGMEGVSVSPDGTRLFAVLQSATLQDNPTNAAVRRNNTRVMVYDISGDKTPTTPISEYVLQLPVYNNSLTGTGNASATAAQSEILALNNAQFLVLSRDGNGRGTNGNANAIAYKSILLVDTAGATNIAGTPYATGTTPISTSAAANLSGALNPAITPVQHVELVNMLNSTQLAKFGINTVTAPSTQYTLSEKWEAMGLVPVLEEGAPQDFFLLIGNDNDFVSNDIDAAGVTDANAALNSVTAGTGNNDNVIMVYRLTLPTYIDPEALAWMQGAVPYAMVASRLTAAQIGTSAGDASLRSLGDSRRFGGDMAAPGLDVWTQGSLGQQRTQIAGGPALSSDSMGFALGGDAAYGAFRVGLAGAYQSSDPDRANVFTAETSSVNGSLYGGVFGEGAYMQAALTIGDVRLKNLTRPAAYSQTATGSTKGDTRAVDTEFGVAATRGDWRIEPFVGLRYVTVKLDGYTETGASVSNAVIPDTEYNRAETSLGLDVTRQTGAVRPSLRASYTTVKESGDTSAVVRLATAASAGATQTVALPVADADFATVSAGLTGGDAGMMWRAGVEGRFSGGETSSLVNVGLAKRF